ncbi:MAG: FtsQ-type POTRA domain-containing protein [Oscillospiraceae bacterium]|nr:FtsQ-type POTRA domain-containing protein [Oscillospiraceae bacterium]
MSSARNKRRRYRRRGRFGFLYKMLAVIALATAVFMGATVFFRVEEVVVEGNVRYRTQAVIDASEIVQGDNLFGLNKFEIARLIRKRLPYVEAVNIRRSLPATLLINVTECRAAAQVPGEDGQWLISRTGKVLERAPEDAAGATIVEGLNAVQPEAGSTLVVREGQQLRTAGLLALLSQLEQNNMLGRVAHIDAGSDARFIMSLDDRFTVKLPVGGDYAYLLGAMEKAIATLEPYEAGTLDLTVKDYTVIFSPA